MKSYSNNTQFAELIDTKPHVYPKYGKSTTDPTYYEPAATRIANMKKSAGVQLEGIYDFYEKSDVEKFNEQNFYKNIRNAAVDPMFVKGLTREEVSQVVNQISDQAQKVVDNKQSEIKSKTERIKENIETSKVVAKAIENNNKSE